MKYIELQQKVSKLNGDYFTEIDRIKVNGMYAQKNRVHVLKKGESEEVAKIFESEKGNFVVFENIPQALTDLIEEYSNTPINERNADVDGSDVNIRC